jgi:hypothetical protein
MPLQQAMLFIMIHGGNMIDIEELDEYQLERLAYAEGFDDGEKGDNYNPYDYDLKPEQWRAYENGYIQGVMAGYDDGQPDEAQEWHDFDPDC